MEILQSCTKTSVCSHHSRKRKSRVTLYTAGHLHTAVPHCSHSRAPIVHTAVPRENNEHGCVYLRCRAVCKLPGCVEGHPWKCYFDKTYVISCTEIDESFVKMTIVSLLATSRTTNDNFFVKLTIFRFSVTGELHILNDILQRIFSIVYSCQKLKELGFKFHWFFFPVDIINWQSARIGTWSDLAPNKRQAITWNIHDSSFLTHILSMCIYVTRLDGF